MRRSALNQRHVPQMMEMFGGAMSALARTEKWGPALLPAPTAPSEGSAGVRNLVDRTFRTTYPLSILAHQLRRRFPSCSSLVRGANLTYSTALPEGSLVVRPDRPARTEVLAKTARCSAALLGNSSIASRFAHFPVSP